ncbi:MAG TPA: hypothetical protein GX506_05690 [Firmicutes bacterium]|nr:hypothetical protein [Bacillota bacterium]
MQAVISVIYYAMVIYFAIVLVHNFVRAKDIQKAILYLVVLMPFVMRVFRLK